MSTLSSYSEVFCGFNAPRTIYSLAGLAIVVALSPIAGFGQTQRQPIIPLAQSTGTAPTSTTAGGANGAISGISDDPISAGEIVHINVFNAPDFSFPTRVSESGNIAVPFLGAVHIAGLSSM